MLLSSVAVGAIGCKLAVDAVRFVEVARGRNDGSLLYTYDTILLLLLRVRSTVLLVQQRTTTSVVLPAGSAGDPYSHRLAPAPFYGNTDFEPPTFSFSYLTLAVVSSALCFHQRAYVVDMIANQTTLTVLIVSF